MQLYIEWAIELLSLRASHIWALWRFPDETFQWQKYARELQHSALDIIVLFEWTDYAKKQFITLQVHITITSFDQVYYQSIGTINDGKSFWYPSLEPS